MATRASIDGTPERAQALAPRRFRPRLVPTLATAIAVALFVSAGQWQFHRMETKEALRARYEAAILMPPSTLPMLPASGDWATERYRRVIAQGQYDAAHQFLLDNKVHAGRVGYDVVTPLKLADGRAVLVDRGWTPAGPTRALLPDVPPPEGVVEVTGRLNLPPARYLELRTESAPGSVWQNLDPARFTRVTGLAVLPAIVEETEPHPADALVREWPAPDFGVDQHRIYMMQWYGFAALALVLWLSLNLRRPVRAPS